MMTSITLPGLQSDDSTTSKIPASRKERTEERIGDHRRDSKNRPSMIDITNLDYKAYRHRLIEATLRKRYDDSQPPGDVVLNSLHLNSADSVIGVRLNDRYDHSLFDFVEEYYDVARGETDRRNVERLHPMDHFLGKSARRPRTTEKETETNLDEHIEYRTSCDRVDGGRNYPPENDNSDFAKLPDTDNNGNPCVLSLPRSVSLEDSVSTIARSDRNSKLRVSRRETTPQSREYVDKTTRRGRSVENDDDSPRFADCDAGSRMTSSWTTRDRRPTSAGNASMLPKGCALSRAVTLPARQKRTTKSPGPAGETSRSRELKKKSSEDYPVVVGFPPSSDKRREEAGGRSTLISVSSSEIVSSDASSGKLHRRDQVSRRSRESSVSPRNPSWSSSQRPPWLAGNIHGTSFNRKYGNITKDPARGSATKAPTRESGLTSSSRRLATISSSVREDAVAGPRYDESDVSRNPTGGLPVPGRRAASFIAPREKEFNGTSSEQRRREQQQRRPATATSSRCQARQEKLKNVARATESNEQGGQTLKIPFDSSTEERVSAITPDNVASPLSSRARRPPAARVCSRTPRALSQVVPSARASVAVSPTRRTTKEPRLTSRCDGGVVARKEHAGKNSSTLPGRRRSKSPADVANEDQRESSTKLNRGERRRRLRRTSSAEEDPSSKGASLSPKIELSATRVLNHPVDDKSAIPDGGVRRVTTTRIDSRNGSRADERASSSAIFSNTNIGRDTKSNNINGVARARVPKIMQNLRVGGRRSASANNLPRVDKSGGVSTPHPGRRDANPGTKSGLNGAKLNTRSNDAVDKMRCDKPTTTLPPSKASKAPPSSSSSSSVPRENIERKVYPEEELQLPRRDSKMDLVMNSGLRRYIKMLKESLLNENDSNKEDVASLASLSLSDAVLLSEQKTPLSPEETRQLQSVLNKIERNPELLREDESSPNTGSVVV